MEQTKPAHKSMGIIGALAVLLTVAANQLGIDFDEAQITEWLLAGSAFIGGLAALYGRFRARSRIEGL